MSSKNIGSTTTTSSVLLVEPTAVYFPPPHSTRSIRNTINLSNASDRFVVFKVRSSNPERFVVKPTTGFATPSSITRLFVTLKRTSEDLAAQGKKDRFRITAKKVRGSVSSKDEPRKVFDASEEVVLDMDMFCSYAAEVPANAVLQFFSGDDASEVGAATPVAPHQVRSVREDDSSMAASPLREERHVPGGRGVSFGTRGESRGGDGGDHHAEAKSVQDALLNAQRVKDSIQADIQALKIKEKDLKEKIVLGSAKSDAMSREALELEELRTKVKLSRDVLAKKSDLVSSVATAASAASAKATNEEFVAGVAASASSAEAKKLPQPPPAMPSLPPSTSVPEAAEPPSPPSSGMYLSTVLLWMITAYMMGMAYRVYAHGGARNDLASILPPEAREAMRSIIAYVKPNLF